MFIGRESNSHRTLLWKTLFGRKQVEINIYQWNMFSRKEILYVVFYYFEGTLWKFIYSRCKINHGLQIEANTKSESIVMVWMTFDYYIWSRIYTLVCYTSRRRLVVSLQSNISKLAKPFLTANGEEPNIYIPML